MDLDAYLARIGYEGRTLTDETTLRGIHRAHATAIPFENLDIQLGLGIDLSRRALERKLVHGRRGGYCFEHNSLLLAALGAIGFTAIACEARVFDPGEGVTPRTHMLLVVTLDGREWLCDVGFGGDTPLDPVPLDGTDTEQGGTRYRVVGRRGCVLQADQGSGWTDQYVFEVSPREAIDFVVANWYTSTHPESRFVRKLTAQQRTATGSRVLRNLEWTVRSPRGIERREIGRAELEALLATEFGIHVPPGARFRALDADPR
jgi:N-hydroxyarylamine O-acetyltransferase